MTEDERALAELAVRKQQLTDELDEVRKQLVVSAKKVQLPVIVALNGHAVHISEGSKYTKLPTCKVARLVKP